MEKTRFKIYKALSVCDIPSIVADRVGDPFEKHYIFCEDKFTLAIELAIAKKKGGSFGTQVFSFNRFMHKFLSENAKSLSPEAGALVIKRLLIENAASLQCFKKVYEPSLANAVYELIAQLKSAKITPNDLMSAYEKATGNLKRKLFDLSLLFEKYEGFLFENSLTDGNNRLSLLPSLIRESGVLSGVRVSVVGYSSLNRQLCAIFDAMVDSCPQIEFVLSCGDNKNVYTNETLNYLSDKYIVDCVSVEENSVRKQLVECLFDYSGTHERINDSSFLHVFSAADCYEEVENIARIIKSSVLSGNRYRDFTIGVNDAGGYRPLFERIFRDYDIPYFVDVKENLLKHPLTLLACSLIDIVRKNYDVEEVIGFSKNSAFLVDKRLSDCFENYVVKNAINRKSIRSPFTYADENLEAYEQIRGAIVRLTEGFDKKATVLEQILYIEKMLVELGVKDNLEALSEMLEQSGESELAAFNRQAYDKFMEVLDRISEILGSKHLPLYELKNVLTAGMTACEISIIPTYNDCVYVGDYKSVKFKKNKFLFMAGMNDGVPSAKLDTALLNDRDLRVLDRAEVNIEPKIQEVNRRERENVCMALVAFEQKLYVSWAFKNIGGEKCGESEIIGYIKNLFQDEKSFCVFNINQYENIAMRSKKQVRDRYFATKYMTGRTADISFAKSVSRYKDGANENTLAIFSYYSYLEEIGRTHFAKDVLDSFDSSMRFKDKSLAYVDKTAYATEIEGYFGCPYKNFVSSGLRIKDDVTGKIMANELGSMIHKIAEKFVPKAERFKNWDSALEFASETFDKVVSSADYVQFTKDASGQAAFALIKKEVMHLCHDLYFGIANSSFKPRYIEVSFGKDNRPAIDVKTGDFKAQVTGKIDRIDTCGKKMRVIDYKTFKADGSLIEDELYTGRKVQLFLYAKAFSDRYTLSGIYYMPISEDLTKGEKAHPVMRLEGRTVADKASIQEMDNTMDDEGNCSYINVQYKTNKDGSLRKNYKALVTDNQLDSLVKYAADVAATGIKEMSEGVIIPSPYAGECTYCKYKGLCGYNDSIDCRTRNLSGVGFGDFSKALAKKTDKEAQK